MASISHLVGHGQVIFNSGIGIHITSLPFTICFIVVTGATDGIGKSFAKQVKFALHSTLKKDNN